MQFELTAEQQALFSETLRFFREHAGHERKQVLSGQPCFDPVAWTQATDQIGLTGIGIDEALGGAGGDLLDLAVLLEAAGHSLTTLPLWASICTGRLVQHLAAKPFGPEWLGRIAGGATVATWAGLFNAEDVSAVQQNGTWTLRGVLPHVVAGDWLESVLVVAPTPAGQHLFALATDSPGVGVDVEDALDPTRPLVTVTLADAPVTEIGGGTLAADSLERARAEIAVLLAAEQVGVGQACLDMAVEYARIREQFGRPIGSFQAIKHLLADLYIDVETARTTMRYAAWALSDEETRESPTQLARLTRSCVTPRITRACAGNLQVHGGIGYTWEHPAHLYYKRALSSAQVLTSVDGDLDVIAAAIGLDD
jgi:alkylation response protein AidB-like acyl-CoA dehydrogenase